MVLPADLDRWLLNGTQDFGYVGYIFEKPS
jgi:hypothetical protein